MSDSEKLGPAQDVPQPEGYEADQDNSESGL